MSGPGLLFIPDTQTQPLQWQIKSFRKANVSMLHILAEERLKALFPSCHTWMFGEERRLCSCEMEVETGPAHSQLITNNTSPPQPLHDLLSHCLTSWKSAVFAFLPLAKLQWNHNSQHLSHCHLKSVRRSNVKNAEDSHRVQACFTTSTTSSNTSYSVSCTSAVSPLNLQCQEKHIIFQ